MSDEPALDVGCWMLNVECLLAIYRSWTFFNFFYTNFQRMVSIE
jgi:hypothetical protein